MTVFLCLAHAVVEDTMRSRRRQLLVDHRHARRDGLPGGEDTVKGRPVQAPPVDRPPKAASRLCLLAPGFRLIPAGPEMALQTELRLRRSQQLRESLFAVGIMAGNTGHLALLRQRQSDRFHGRDDADSMLAPVLPAWMTPGAELRKRPHEGGASIFGNRDVAITAFMNPGGKGIPRPKKSDR